MNRNKYLVIILAIVVAIIAILLFAIGNHRKTPVNQQAQSTPNTQQTEATTSQGQNKAEEWPDYLLKGKIVDINQKEDKIDSIVINAHTSFFGTTTEEFRDVIINLNGNTKYYIIDLTKNTTPSSTIDGIHLMNGDIVLIDTVESPYKQIPSNQNTFTAKRVGKYRSS